MSWLSALSVGSIAQNIVFYLFVSFLVYANYCLMEAKKAQQRGKVDDHRVRKSRADLMADIDDLVLKGKVLEDRIAGLENVLERINDPLYMVDRDWNFTYINQAYEKVQHRDRAKLLGRNVWELFPYGKERCYFKEYSRALREQVSVHFEEFNTFNGMWVSASAYPVKSGLAICFRDITKEKLRRNLIG